MMSSSMTSASMTWMWPGGGGGSAGSNCGRRHDDGGGRPVAANWVGRHRQCRGSDAKRNKEMRRCRERGGNSTTSRCKRDGGATREEAMQQPTSTREAQRKERHGGATREGRGGMARGCTGSTTKGDAARQQVF